MFRRPGGISNGDLHGEKEMKRIVEILLWIWQAPQNIVGLVIRLIYGGYPLFPLVYKHCVVIQRPNFPGGISLGRTIMVKRVNIDGYKDNPTLWDHEHGHARQSLYLGPFYLFVVGIPSLLWAWYWNPSRGGSYYSFFTEKWADKLGGVKRQ